MLPVQKVIRWKKVWVLERLKESVIDWLFDYLSEIVKEKNDLDI